jgi:hypothetical protein
MITSRISLPSLFTLAMMMVAATSAHALGQQVGREQEITDLRLGQRVLVDDGSCPAGQIKEVTGAKLTAAGITRAIKCIPRNGPKQK